MEKEQNYSGEIPEGLERTGHDAVSEPVAHEGKPEWLETEDDKQAAIEAEGAKSRVVNESLAGIEGPAIDQERMRQIEAASDAGVVKEDAAEQMQESTLIDKYRPEFEQMLGGMPYKAEQHRAMLLKYAREQESRKKVDQAFDKREAA